MKRTQYTAGGLISHGDAQLVGDAITAIETGLGRLSTKEQAAELVKRSRPAKSDTHHLFEWDDRVAAEEHRLARAKDLIRVVCVTFEEHPDTPVHAFPIVVTAGKRGPYPMSKVLASKDLRSAMLEDAKAEMQRFRIRYEGLRELADVFAAIDRHTKRKAG